MRTEQAMPTMLLFGKGVVSGEAKRKCENGVLKVATKDNGFDEEATTRELADE